MATAAANSTERLKALLEKIPVFPLFLLYVGYLGYQYYGFMNDPDSPRQQKQIEINALKDQNAKLDAKLKQAKESSRMLAQKEVELRDLARQLGDMKATLSDQTNEAEFMKLILKEASAVGLTVNALKPSGSKDYEYYSEKTFDVSFRGYFVQLVVFLDRMSQTERIVRVDNFEVHRVGSNLSPYVELSGTVQVKVYRYLGSKADELAKSMAPLPVSAPIPTPTAHSTSLPQATVPPAHPVPPPSTSALGDVK